MLGQGWSSQWERVQRRLEEVRRVYSGRPGGTDEAIDVVLTFFEAAYHLRDWLWNDPSSGVTRAEGKAVVKASPVLRLCVDLANGSKHLILKSTQTGDYGTEIARNDVRVFVGTGTSAHRFYIASGGVEHDVLDIAEKAVAEWRAFLEGRGLISPTS